MSQVRLLSRRFRSGHSPILAFVQVCLDTFWILVSIVSTFLGYRAVPLKNIYGEDLELSALLIQITQNYTTDPTQLELLHVRQQIVQKGHERSLLLAEILKAAKGGREETAVCL